MALALLDGTSAAVDFTVPSTPTGTPVSLKCLASDISIVYRRPTTSKTTFCSASWVTPTPGIRQGFGHIGGFVSTGIALSNPLVLFNNDLALPFVFTADTGNTITQNMVVTQDMLGVRALAEFARGIDFETSGAPTILWTVS